MHTPLQTCWPAGHWQLPITQLAPAAQALPHEPQFEGSLEVATQRPLQSEVPAGHAHAPLVHDCPSAQVMPQPPQFDGLLRVSTH